MESYRDEFLTPEDLEEERAYFSFVGELLNRHDSRYELEAKELVKQGRRFSRINESILQFKLDRIGCAFSLSEDQGETFQELSWTRLGWRKASKLEYLPFFFADCEAKVLLAK